MANAAADRLSLNKRYEHLGTLKPNAGDLTLARMQTLLGKLGEPHKKLPPVIHVAGTNGKGSTVAFARALLEAHGLRTHVFTSPHLVNFNERIRLAGTLISNEALAALLDEVEAINNGAPITPFEIITAAAFLAFSRTPAEALVLEVGLGGRLDATNLATAHVCAITRLSYDHCAILGDSLTQIATEKAGIIKTNAPVMLSRQPDAAAKAVIAKVAQQQNAPLWQQDQDWRIEPQEGFFTYSDKYGQLRLPLPALAGAHQLDNAALALACARHFPDMRLKQQAAAQAMLEVSHPARLQQLNGGALSQHAPQAEIWLDGAHNDSGAEVLAAFLHNNRTDRPTIMIMGMLNSKNPELFLAPLRPYLAALYAVPIADEPKSLAPEFLCQMAAPLPAQSASNLTQALQAIAQTTPHARVIIAGSLYLMGQALLQEGSLPT